MQSKLTLRIDGQLIRRAKELAHARGTSVSALVASYFAAMEPGHEAQVLTPGVRRLRGLLSDVPADREAYREHLRNKHKK